MENLNVVNGLDNVVAAPLLSQFLVDQLSKNKVGKAMIDFYYLNGTFEGFVAPEKVTTKRVKRNVPDGSKFCHDCYKEGLAAGLTETEAEALAIHVETDFAKAGKDENGVQTYGNYCKKHTNARTAANMAKNANRLRIASITETYLPKALLRVAELEAELAGLQNAAALSEVEVVNNEVN